VREPVDLFLALAVVEHCPDYRGFIRKAMALQPRYIVVSFFRGLSTRKEDRIVKRKSVESEWSTAGGVYWDNRYCQRNLVAYLKSQDPSRDWYLTWLDGDVVLVIEIE
jgi:hypothetical protein